MRHQVFLSSVRVADERLAIALRRSLERFGAPWYGKGSISVALPEAQRALADASPELVVEPLGGAQALILVASPYAAHSATASRQCAWWAANKDPARLFILRADGDVAWSDGADDTSRDFDWDRTNALPETLRGALRQKPLILDVAWARQLGDLGERDPRFLDVVARLAAAIRGMSLDAVVGEAARRHVQSRQAALAGAAVLAAVAIVGSYSAWNSTQRLQASEQARAALVDRHGQAEAARIAAERQRADIDAQRRLADDRRTDAERQRAEMERQRSEAEVQARLADARRVEAEKLRADAEKQADVARQASAMWQSQAEREKQRAEALARQTEEARLAGEARYGAAEARRAEAERQRTDAERQRNDADRLRGETERLRAEADQRRERAETRLGTAGSAAEALALALTRAVSDTANGTAVLSAERRAQILESAETLNEQLRGSGGTPEQRHRAAQVRLALADAYARIGDHRRALDRAVAARTTLEALQQQGAGNGRLDAEILATYVRAGEALAAQGEHARALQTYRDAIPVSEKFAAQDTNDGTRQFESAALRLRIAGLLKVIGDLPSARREAEAAADLLRRLVARPEGQRWQAALAEAEATLHSLGRP